MIGEELNRELNDLHGSIGRINQALQDIRTRLERLESGNGTIHKVESRLAKEMNRIHLRFDHVYHTIDSIRNANEVGN